ncbi:hypothetical protein [Thalassospira xiamenensis]|uniref:Uncharacterized protein n=1 Tax=Thalassospira xiamenensis TaxID=220697 RepID=A0A285TS70_9PROT|nr:hypothetical protein [Thalassospira xiamenensis]SOC26313.1 hypothetical protein SAMN05428964_10595 [Thalassospira xiamenensis]
MSGIDLTGIPEHKQASIAGIHEFGLAWRGEVGLGGLPTEIGSSKLTDAEMGAKIVRLGELIKRNIPLVIPCLADFPQFDDMLEFFEDFKGPMIGEGEPFANQEEALGEFRFYMSWLFDNLDYHRVTVADHCGNSPIKNLRDSEKAERQDLSLPDELIKSGSTSSSPAP